MLEFQDLITRRLLNAMQYEIIICNLTKHLVAYDEVTITTKVNEARCFSPVNQML